MKYYNKDVYIVLLVHCGPPLNGVINCTSDATVTGVEAFEEDGCTFCYNTGYFALQGSANRICISEKDPLCITG